MGFELFVPEDRDELFGLMEEGDYQLLAGGTDLFVKIEKDLIDPDRVIDVTRVIRCPKIKDEAEKSVVSATATHGKLANSATIQREFPVLARSAEAVGATQLRNMATIGGNICNASPSADTLIALYLLKAEVNLVGQNGRRSLPIEEFITGPGEVGLKQGEYLESISLPKLAGDYTHFFEKVGRRNALEISVCSMGYTLKKKADQIEEIRLAYGAVAPTIVRPASVESFLRGKSLNEKTLAEAGDLLREEISPISDIRGSAEYREEVAIRLLRRLQEDNREAITG